MTNFDGKLENALNNYWKLKAIDAIQPSREESNRIISALIDDREIRRVLLNEEPQLSEALNEKIDDAHDASLTVQNQLFLFLYCFCFCTLLIRYCIQSYF